MLALVAGAQLECITVGGIGWIVRRFVMSPDILYERQEVSFHSFIRFIKD